MYQGVVYKVTAPCVIIQWPGAKLDYGPDKSWYEVYFIYPIAAGAYLHKRKFFRQVQPIWHIYNFDRILEGLSELKKVLTAPLLSPDRVDYLCEGIIMESLLAQPTEPQEIEEQKIRIIESYIRNNFTIKHDYTQLAKQQGMSLSTFLRRWLEYTGVPPAKYQNSLLMQEACRLLTVSTESIKEIAEMLDFQDPLYFTKKFHKEIGTTPTSYRKQHSQFLIN